MNLSIWLFGPTGNEPLCRNVKYYSLIITNHTNEHLDWYRIAELVPDLFSCSVTAAQLRLRYTWVLMSQNVFLFLLHSAHCLFCSFKRKESHIENPPKAEILLFPSISCVDNFSSGMSWIRSNQGGTCSSREVPALERASWFKRLLGWVLWF